MELLYIFGLVCFLVAMIASLIGHSWFAAVGFLGGVLIAFALYF